LALKAPSLAGLLLGAMTLLVASGVAADQADGPDGSPDASAPDAPPPDASPPDAPPPDTPGRSGRLPVDFELSAGTRFPLELGIEGAVEAPYGITAHLGFGFMPRFYRDAINEAAVGFGWYDDTDASLVAAALEDAFLISPTLGWRPPPLPALEVFAGYTIAFAGGTLTRMEAEQASDMELPNAARIDEVPLGGTVHAFQLGVAYHIALQEHLALRLSLAYFQVVGSSSSIDVTVNGAAARRVVTRVERELDEYLRDLLTTYVKSPLVGVAAVWRF
jgi:hypothetical protein